MHTGPTGATGSRATNEPEAQATRQLWACVTWLLITMTVCLTALMIAGTTVVLFLLWGIIQ